eukprot:COSAG02_NODE_326_length_24603_cov_123.455681_5_plen_126_part_00
MSAFEERAIPSFFLTAAAEGIEGLSAATDVAGDAGDIGCCARGGRLRWEAGASPRVTGSLSAIWPAGGLAGWWRERSRADILTGGQKASSTHLSLFHCQSTSSSSHSSHRRGIVSSRNIRSKDLI